MAGPNDTNDALLSIPAVKVVQDVPVIYADGIASHANSPKISKFYFFRIDPDPNGASPGKPTFVSQVVMPMDGFLQMWAFIEHRLKLMIKAGAISKADIGAARASTRSLEGWSSDPL